MLTADYFSFIVCYCSMNIKKLMLILVSYFYYTHYGRDRRGLAKSSKNLLLLLKVVDFHSFLIYFLL